MKRFFLSIFCGLLLAACGGGQDAASSDGEADVRDSLLYVAVTPTLDCLPLYVADSLGLFGEVGVPVRLCVYRAHIDCDTALERRFVDGSFTDLVRAERLRQRGVGLDYSTSTALSWQLLSRHSARIRQFRQLDDKMLGMTRFSATALLADMAADNAKLETDSVNGKSVNGKSENSQSVNDNHVFFIQVNDVCLRLDMLKNNILDALLLPEPQATQARNERAYVMLDTRSLDLRLGVLAFRSELKSDTLRRHQIDLLLKTYDMACDSISRHGLGHYRNLIAEACSVPAATVDSLPADFRFEHVRAPRQSDIDKAVNWLKQQK